MSRTVPPLKRSRSAVRQATTTADFTLLPQTQLVLSVSPPVTSTSPVVGTSPQVQVTGGSGTGTLVYQLGPGAPASCAVSSSGVVTSQLAVTCPILVTKDASGSYGPTSSTINVPFVAGPVSSTHSTIVADPSPVTNPGTTTVTVTLEDQYGNPVDDQTITLTGTGSASVSSSPVNTGGTNIAQFTVSDSAAETTTLSAVDTSQSNYAIGSTQATFSAAPSGGGGGGGGGGGSTSLLVTTTSLNNGAWASRIPPRSKRRERRVRPPGRVRASHQTSPVRARESSRVLPQCRARSR